MVIVAQGLERPDVAREAAGSIPVFHPIFLNTKQAEVITDSGFFCAFFKFLKHYSSSTALETFRVAKRKPDRRNLLLGSGEIIFNAANFYRPSAGIK